MSRADRREYEGFLLRGVQYLRAIAGCSVRLLNRILRCAFFTCCRSFKMLIEQLRVHNTALALDNYSPRRQPHACRLYSQKLSHRFRSNAGQESRAEIQQRPESRNPPFPTITTNGEKLARQRNSFPCVRFSFIRCLIYLRAGALRPDDFASSSNALSFATTFRCLL